MDKEIQRRILAGIVLVLVLAFFVSGGNPSLMLAAIPLVVLGGAVLLFFGKWIWNIGEQGRIDSEYMSRGERPLQGPPPPRDLWKK